METFIGCCFIYTYSSGNGREYSAYKIVDYVGHDHILVKKVGSSYPDNTHLHWEKHGNMQVANGCMRKTAIIELKEFIEDFKKNRLCFCEIEDEIKLTDLKDVRCRLHGEDIDEWIMALTRETCRN